jgi:uncharacterized protein (DUF1697 family)
MIPATHLALLRGINVGGKNKLPMKDLLDMFVEAGCKDVRTYIQSGNVVFNASPRVFSRVADQITTMIAGRFGYRTPVILQTAPQLRDVLSGNPFLTAETNEKALYVMFLAHTPTPADIDKLDPDRSPGDSFIVRGQVVYLHLPNDVAGTKLTNAYFDSKLGTIGTSRNWRTVTKLLELMTGEATLPKSP